jgi:small GTP-binding protein
MKILVVGDSHVGKSSLLVDTAEEVEYIYVPTEGVDFRDKTLCIDGNYVTVQIYDCTGQENLQHITSRYYDRVDCLMIVYDITNLSSFQHVYQWLRNVKSKNQQDISLMLIGNKCDVTSHRAITYGEGKQLATEIGATFYETSAVTRKNVDEALDDLIRDGLSRKRIQIKNARSEISNVKRLFSFIKASSN